MHVVDGRSDLVEAARGAVLAIGNFDGVHRGHKALIANVRALAGKDGSEARARPAGVMVFEPHPREFFQPDVPHFRLTPLPEKLRLLRAEGIDLCVVLNFDAALAAMSAENFIAEILVRRLGVSHVVIGYDFCFGHKRQGSAETMRAAGKRFGFGVSVIDQQGDENNDAFSSSQIRTFLRAGDVDAARLALGHTWRVSGSVTHGAKLGTEFGFPTANLALPDGFDLRHGVYAVQVVIGQSRYQGAAYFGSRPSVDGGPARLEVFIFDFQGDLYEKDIAIEFVAFVREDSRFESFEALKAQMARDCERARKILSLAE